VKDPDNEAKPKACHKDTKSQRKAKSFHRKERHDAKKIKNFHNRAYSFLTP
jgi:hypothetical protein